MILILSYLILAAICGFLGSKTRIGFWGCFMLSLIITPLLVILLLVLFKEPLSKRKAEG
jgi:hypothetical protein